MWFFNFFTLVELEAKGVILLALITVLLCDKIELLNSLSHIELALLLDHVFDLLRPAPGQQRVLLLRLSYFFLGVLFFLISLLILFVLILSTLRHKSTIAVYRTGRLARVAPIHVIIDLSG